MRSGGWAAGLAGAVAGVGAALGTVAQDRDRDRDRERDEAADAPAEEDPDSLTAAGQGALGAALDGVGLIGDVSPVLADGTLTIAESLLLVDDGSGGDGDPSVIERAGLGADRFFGGETAAEEEAAAGYGEAGIGFVS